MKAKRLVPILLVLVLMAGCASFTTNTYRTMYTAGVSYDTSMKVIANLQAQGKITQAQRDEINKYANIYYVSYQTAVKAFSTYNKTQTAADKDKLTIIISQVIASWADLASYVNRIVPGTIPASLEVQ
jgi:hypothetical protein